MKILGALSLGLLAVLPLPAEGAGLTADHLYYLSDFSGTIAYSDVFLYVDRARDEVYATEGGMVRIFNGSGMEVYRFSKDWAPGTIFAMGVEPSGDILLLLRDYASGPEPSWSLQRCDYRGRPLGAIEPRGWPADLASFSPDRMAYQDGVIHLVSSSSLRAVVIDADGTFLRTHDLAALAGVDKPHENEIFGFSLDRAGNMLFTIPTLFKAFVVSPDEVVQQFGTPGSAPGKFGVVSGIVADDDGDYLVADKLRHVVMAFDPSFQLITEIGVEGGRQNLVRPTDLAMGNSGRLYITQARNRGVSVYALMKVGGSEARASEETGGEPGDPVRISSRFPRKEKEEDNR